MALPFVHADICDMHLSSSHFPQIASRVFSFGLHTPFLLFFNTTFLANVPCKLNAFFSFFPNQYIGGYILQYQGSKPFLPNFLADMQWDPSNTRRNKLVELQPSGENSLATLIGPCHSSHSALTFFLAYCNLQKPNIHFVLVFIHCYLNIQTTNVIN